MHQVSDTISGKFVDNLEVLVNISYTKCAKIQTTRRLDKLCKYKIGVKEM